MNNSKSPPVNQFINDIDGKPVLANCENCKWCDDQSDWTEYGSPWYICSKEGREHVSNLNNFPFKTAQPCCELGFWHFVDWEVLS